MEGRKSAWVHLNSIERGYTKQKSDVKRFDEISGKICPYQEICSRLTLSLHISEEPEKSPITRLKTSVSNTRVNYSLSSVCKTVFQKVLSKGSKGR